MNYPYGWRLARLGPLVRSHKKVDRRFGHLIKDIKNITFACYINV